ncbi:acetyl-CoA synthetase-like protein [Trichodelitschia bisporula]|uniref:Acetyl-CoA synthetase-like protein n=1 Tax=Trichodelitschia bisporula TaxID=703511 RepID=A0A6G1HTT8_9PEZI|nr:acetyl-CoA synthetase-like protein [Trichodelitschia bisporula]
MSRTYRHPKTYPIPDVDLLTLLFASPHSAALDDSVLHASAATPSVSLNKVGLRRLFEEFAFGLRNRFNIGASGPNKDVVVVFSSGQPAYPAAFFGIIAAGGIASLASPSGTAHETARQIKSGGGSLVIVSEDLLDIAREAVKEAPATILVLRSEPDWSLRIDGQGEEGELRGKSMYDRLTWDRITDPKKLKESLIVLLYSSGTTGEPKGVMLSHLNFVAELIVLTSSSREWTAKQVEAGAKFPPYRTLAHLPAAHIAGVTGYLIGPAYSGGTVFWMRKYNWPDFLKYNKALGITAFYSVPSIYLRIAKDPAVTDHFKTLVYASGGAAPLDGNLQKAAKKKIGVGETNVSQAWGLSETTGAVTAPERGQTPDDTGSISGVLPNLELRIVDEQDNDVEPGQSGEILVRGPVVTNGYWRNEAATKGAFRNGWFATGDIAVDRNGKFYIIDRIKELIKYKGLQVAPAEIEGLLVTHPEIMEAAVVGIPDPSEEQGDGPASSEVPRAYVVKRPGSNLKAEDVKEFVLARLAPYKQLRGGVVFMDELPKNALGKLLRRDLRDKAVKEIRAGPRAKL